MGMHVRTPPPSASRLWHPRWRALRRLHAAGRMALAASTRSPERPRPRLVLLDHLPGGWTRRAQPGGLPVFGLTERGTGRDRADDEEVPRSWRRSAGRTRLADLDETAGAALVEETIEGFQEAMADASPRAERTEVPF